MEASNALGHYSVMLKEVISYLPMKDRGFLLDVTAGGGGHFFEMLKIKTLWVGECWDRDPDAEKRIAARGQGCVGRFKYIQKSFGAGPEEHQLFDFILADLGISSFQLDDPLRGMSFHSQSPVDFRMNPFNGTNFSDWIEEKSEKQLEEILIKYGEELRAKKIASVLKSIENTFHHNAAEFSQELMKRLHLKVKKNELHPLTRTFQALRIAINDELGELASLLDWGPKHLTPGGRLAIISFHSLEDRKVKRVFDAKSLEGYKILTDKALTPSEMEVEENSRSRSAKLRVLERVGD